MAIKKIELNRKTKNSRKKRYFDYIENNFYLELNYNSEETQILYHQNYKNVYYKYYRLTKKKNYLKLKSTKKYIDDYYVDYLSNEINYNLMIELILEYFNKYKNKLLRNKKRNESINTRILKKNIIRENKEKIKLKQVKFYLKQQKSIEFIKKKVKIGKEKINKLKIILENDGDIDDFDIQKLGRKSSKSKDKKLIAKIKTKIDKNPTITYKELQKEVIDKKNIKQISTRTLKKIIDKNDYIKKTPKPKFEGKRNSKKYNNKQKYEKLSKIYFALLNNKNKKNLNLFFLDETYLNELSFIPKCFIKDGEELKINCEPKKQSLSVLSMVNFEGKKYFKMYNHSITSIDLLKFLEEIILNNYNYERDKNIIIMDNARCHQSKITNDTLWNFGKIIYLPPYSPDLNLIEKIFQIFKKKIMKYCRINTSKEFEYNVLSAWNDIRDNEFKKAIEEFKQEFSYNYIRKFYNVDNEFNITENIYFENNYEIYNQIVKDNIDISSEESQDN